MQRRFVVVVVVAVALFLAGCGPAVHSQQVRGPDGTTDWLAIQCEGEQAKCIQWAGEACPHGYDIADSRGHTDTTSTSYANVGPAGAVAGTSSRSTYEGEMFIRCHGDIAAFAKGYRDCIDEASCETGDKCVFGLQGMGRCQKR